MGEIKEKKKITTLFVCYFCITMGQKMYKKKRKKKSIYECAMHDSKDSGSLAKKKKKNLTYDKAAGNPFTPQLRCRHPPHPTPGFPYP